MNRETVDGDTSHWSKGPVTVTPGISRGLLGAVSPGTSSMQGSKRLLTSNGPLSERVPKRPRLSEPSERAQIHSKPHNREPIPAWTPGTKSLPHSTTKMTKSQKKSRVANMKGQLKNGGNLSIVAPAIPRPYSGLPTSLTGRDHPPSQPSVSSKHHPKVGKKMVLDAANSIPMRAIKGMFFEWDPYDALTDACLTFDEKGPRLTLKFSGNEMHIFKDDVKWMKTDNLTHLFICIKTGARINRQLEEAHLWMPKTSVEGFPSHTISLKFQRHDLEDPDQHINCILDSMRGRPPDDFVSVSLAWSVLARRRETKPPTTIETTDDGSDLTSSSSETELPPSRSARNLSAQVSGTTKQPTRASGVKTTDLDNKEVMLVYPFTGTGSTQITRGEHQRLCEDESLNDTLVEFGLRHWLESLKETNPGLAEQIHVFSPFFYRKLKHKDPQAGYNAVKKWTSKVDIFQKRYLIVPIYERLHWYLVIIMYPENMLHSAKPIYQEAEPPMSPGFREEELLKLPDEESTRSIYQEIEPPSPPGFREEELLNLPDEELYPHKSYTWLLSFDSLAMKRLAALKTLREYLMLEARYKKAVEPHWSTLTCKKVPIPMQPNEYDSGIYLIKTVETFLSRPDEFFQRLVDENDQLTERHPLWNHEGFSTKREALFETIAKLSLEWMQFKTTTEAGKAPKAIPTNEPKPPNSPTEGKGGPFTDEDGDDKVRPVGKAPASSGRAARPVQSKIRRARRF